MDYSLLLDRVYPRAEVAAIIAHSPRLEATLNSSNDGVPTGGFGAVNTRKGVYRAWPRPPAVDLPPSCSRTS